jgi:MerR family transcriptional regulator, light-induced transcriptional regulator
MRTLKTSEAAALLNVTANTLRAWERRFGYPKPQRSRGNHRLYTYAEVAALREALQEGLSISSAVSVAREALTTDVHALVRALGAFDGERSDRALEASLGLRSLERTVEEVLLPALRDISRREGTDTAHWAFAATWGADWLRRARRLSPPPARGISLLVGDACGSDLDPSTAQVRALELFCTRAGAEVLTLPVEAPGGLADVVAAVEPDAIVIAGSRAGDEALSRWAYRVRSATGRLPLALFHRDVHAVGPESRARVLPPVPSAAQEDLFAVIETRPGTRLATVKEAG